MTTNDTTYTTYTISDLALTTREGTEGYHVADFFDAELPEEFTREWLRAHYRGADVDGVGVLVAGEPLDTEDGTEDGTKQSQREADLAAIEAAQELERRIRDAVTADRPDLRHYLMRLSAIVRTGPGEDDWRWDGSVRGRARRAREFLREAVGVAAARISEAYGLGAGSEWAERHFGVAGDERAAEAQVLESLRRLGI